MATQSPPRGFFEASERRIEQVAQAVVETVRRIERAAGPPWGSDRIKESEVLDRIDEWERPSEEVLAVIRGLRPGQRYAAALDAVRRRQAAIKAGTRRSR
ncbi:MAG: hypothetical protein CL878_07315 [Dehalococcoidia bacterium]|nr:hypothetical protein [Dehalococcoidia bacterium]